jgi:hypothetical protein
LLLSYFQVILESSPALASLQMMPWTLTTALSGPLVGHLVVRLRAGTVMIGGLLVAGIGAAGWWFVRPETPFVWVAVPLMMVERGASQP